MDIYIRKLKELLESSCHKKIKRYKTVEYYMDIMCQSVCLVMTPITVYSYGFHYDCMVMGQALDE